MCVLSHIAFRKIFGRYESRADGRPSASVARMMAPDFDGYLRDREANRKRLEALPFEKIVLESADHIPLTAHFYRNPVPGCRTAILVHGYRSCGFEGYATVGLAYIRQGYNILLPDNRACGESGGKWSTFGILESKDTALWAEYLARRFPQDCIILHGCSLGGATVCFLSSQKLPDSVRAIVSDCAFSDIEEQLAYILRTMLHIPPYPLLWGVEGWFRLATGLSVRAYSPLESVKHARLPIFFVHGACDGYVLPKNVQRLYQACCTEKELLVIPGAGHAAAHRFGGEAYYGPIFAFLDRHTEA